VCVCVCVCVFVCGVCTAVLKLRLAISMARDKGPVGWVSAAACGRCEEREDKDDAWKWSSVRGRQPHISNTLGTH
jgi:hypothetical protein